ncbi:MAG: PadR family transcriptional regulator [Elusimicrobia bacterium RIFOXYD12_FULL_66_9]|nr:MAG: PadR family transcriptional regulator [Elusimicrobia bacterium RIFOXYD12_FULL_66_9]
MDTPMIDEVLKPATREILLAFWKVHILHHAAEGPIHGQWVTEELRRHGYEISPGTLYPLLNRLERQGWLRRLKGERGGPKARKSYRLTARGLKVLDHVRRQVRELYEEVACESKRR